MKAAILLAVLTAVSGGLALVVLDGPAGQVLAVEVTEVEDTWSTGTVTRLTVNVTNLHDEPIEPWFTVPNNRLMNWYPWTIEEGPGTLEPGETATYTLTQPPWTGIPRGRTFQLFAQDVHENDLRGVSESVPARPPQPAPSARNPDFRSWQPSMIAPYKLPFGWIPRTVLHDGDDFEIHGGEGRLTLELDPDMNRTGPADGPKAWSMVALRQRIDFPSSFRVAFANGTRTDFALGPQTIAGVSLEDPHAGRQLVILFAQHPTAPDQPERGLLDFGDFETERILVTNRSARIDVLEVWEDNGWRIPETDYVPRPEGAGSRNVGFGTTSIAQAYDQFQPMRPLELKVLVASFPPHQEAHVEATFDYVGGPALDAGPEVT